MSLQTKESNGTETPVLKSSNFNFTQKKIRMLISSSDYQAARWKNNTTGQKRKV